MDSSTDLISKCESLCEADCEFAAVYNRSIELIDRAIDLYGVDGTCFSFNGGKDSTVVFHLLRIVLATRQQSLASQPVMYFDSKNQFKEVRAFMERTTARYNLSCHVYKCSYIEGVKDLITTSNVRAIYMGVRGGDPRTEELEHFSPSSKGWPAFMRINPILRWSYHDVWKFLRTCELEYCGLYDHGYTSLGDIYNTTPNSALWKAGEKDSDGKYLPAYELKDSSLERAGRSVRPRRPSEIE